MTNREVQEKIAVLKARIDKGDQWLYEHQGEKTTQKYKDAWKLYKKIIKEYEELLGIRI